MATHSSTLALKIPWTEELGAGYYPWGRKELCTTEQLHFTLDGGGRTLVGIFLIFICIYLFLAVPGLSCSTWNLVP